MMSLTAVQISELTAQFFLAAAGTLSFAILFACPRRCLPYCALVGAVGWLWYELLTLLVNLGSEDEPFADGDARTVLRRAVAPGMSERLAGLVCLDSSKCQDPPPVFFRWHATAYGPALAEHNAPSDLAGKRWRKLHEVIRGRRAEMRQEAKDEGRRALVSQVVRAVARLTEDGKQATARAVSVAAGKSPTWGTPYLQDAVRDGLLVSREEKVERRRDPAVVYYLNDSTEF